LFRSSTAIAWKKKTSEDFARHFLFSYFLNWLCCFDKHLLTTSCLQVNSYEFYCFEN
jgi:hypothetical protein